MKIGIDLDDTVWKFHEKLIEYYNNKYNTNYNIKNYSNRNISEFFGITFKQEEELLDAFSETDSAREVALIDGFLDVFLKLKEISDIYFITARPTKLKELVKTRLKFFGGDIFPVYHMYNSKSKIRSKKCDICNELGIDIMIDDGLCNLEEFSGLNINCFLLDYPWNQKEDLSENIIRVKDWNEILEKIKK